MIGVPPESLVEVRGRGDYGTATARVLGRAQWTSNGGFRASGYTVLFVDGVYHGKTVTIPAWDVVRILRNEP